MSASELTFAEYLQQLRGRLPRTAEAYGRDTAAFEQWCTDQKLEPAMALNRAQIGLYIMQRTRPGARRDSEPARLSSRSAARAVSALRAYGEYLEFIRGSSVDSSSRREASSSLHLSAPKYSRKLPAYLNVEELLAIVRAFDGLEDAAGRRNGALLRLLYSAGLRVSECAGLRLLDVSLGERMLSVTGKGNKARTVPFGENAASSLQTYLELARPLLTAAAASSAGLNQPAAPLWLSTRGQPLGPRAIQRIVGLAAARAGCVKPLSPHKLRHACATHMLEGGADVRLLQELLGHSSINTTQVYTQVTRRQLLESYEQTHPRAKK